MFGTTPLSILLGAPPAYPYEAKTIKSYVRQLAKSGLHILLCAPGSKIPIDIRTKQQADKDKENGLDRGGVYLATDDTRRLDSYINRYLKNPPKRRTSSPSGYGPDTRLTLAVHLGPSRLVVIDADTDDEVAAVQHYWAAKTGLDVDKVPSPTVATPGMKNVDGEDVHKNGRHWYFRLPEHVDIDETIPSGVTVKVPEVGSQFTIKTGNSCVLIPPSYRNGAEYRLVAPDVEMPEWVWSEITTAAHATVGKQQAREQREEQQQAIAETQKRQADMFAQTLSAGNPFATAVGQESEQDGHCEPVGTERDQTGINPVATDNDSGAGSSTDIEPTVVDDSDDNDDDTTPLSWSGETLDEQLEDWSENTSWADILEPHGWTLADRHDTSCGCDVWTRPGVVSTPKSATAHGPGCNRGRTDTGHPAIHIWSDHVEGGLASMIEMRGSRTLSKMDVYAALNHDCDRGEALRDIGIGTTLPGGGGTMLPGNKDLVRTRMDAETSAVLDGVEHAPVRREVTVSAPDVVDTPAGGVLDHHPGHDDAFTMPTVPLVRDRAVTTPSGVDVLASWGVETPEPGDELEWRKGFPPIGSFDDFRDMPPVRWTVEGLLERGGLTSVIGESGTGKSAVVLDLACTVASGTGSWYGHVCDTHPVIYIAGEGVSGAVERVKAWERANGASVGDRLWIVPESVPLSGSKEVWAYISHLARAIGAGLIILDTFARMNGSLDENSASDMSTAVRRLDKIRATTGAGVLVVHHTTRGTRHGRGSTALNGAMDSELLLEAVGDEDDQIYDDNGDEVLGKAIKLSVSKQKNGPDDAVLNLVLTEEKDVTAMTEYPASEKTSLVVTDVNGRPSRFKATYLTDEPARTFAGVKKEPVADTATRVLEFVESFHELESTITDIASGVIPDGFHTDKAKLWKVHIRRAVDYLVSTGKLWRVGNSSTKFTSQPPLD